MIGRGNKLGIQHHHRKVGKDAGVKQKVIEIFLAF